jgi:hypothetical protein
MLHGIQASVPLLPRARRNDPSLFRYVVSIHPLVSSPSSLNGTGYGILKGKTLHPSKHIHLKATLCTKANMLMKCVEDAACLRTWQTTGYNALWGSWDPQLQFSLCSHLCSSLVTVVPVDRSVFQSHSVDVGSWCKS